MDWNCALTEERLSDLLEASLLTEEAEAFSTHAAGCERCTKLVAQVGGLVTRMQELPLVEEPPRLAGKILDATLGPRKQNREAQGWFRWVPVIWQPRFAMGIVTVAASLVIVVHAVGSPAARTSLNPVNLVRDANRQAHLTYARGAKFVDGLRVVYEIQSRLSSQPETMSEPISVPATTPAVKPAPGQEQEQPSRDLHEKSQTVPHSIRRDSRGGAEMAIAWSTSFSDNSLNGTLRSHL
jgi:hypothetical protein